MPGDLGLWTRLESCIENLTLEGATFLVAIVGSRLVDEPSKCNFRSIVSLETFSIWHDPLISVHEL